MSVIDDATLLKMAEAEILGEAKRAEVRHSTAGVSGWQPCPKPNKMFLTNTILQTMASNRILTSKTSGKREKGMVKKRSERKLLQRKTKTDMDTNFIYMKPNKSKEKLIISTKTSRFKNPSSRPGDNQSKNVKDLTEKCHVKKIKLKKS